MTLNDIKIHNDIVHDDLKELLLIYLFVFPTDRVV